MTKLTFNKRPAGYARVNRVLRENCDTLIANIRNLYYRYGDRMTLADLTKLLEMARTIEKRRKVLHEYERDNMYKNLEKIRSRYRSYQR